MDIKVSVIIPTYLRADNLIRAIESVLGQTFQELEIIVVDDNGKGTVQQLKTEELLHGYIVAEKIRYIVHEKNRNGSAARNTGVHDAQGEMVAFLDDDDVFEPTKIARQVDALSSSRNPLCRAVYCNSRSIKGGRVVLVKNRLTGRLTQELLSGEVVFNSSTLLIYKDVFEELNGFDESFMRHQDWEFLVRYFRLYDIGLVAPHVFLVDKFLTDNVVSRNPYKVAEYNEKFLAAFEGDIQACADPNAVMYYQYRQVANALLRFSCFKMGFRYLRKAASYKGMYVKDLVHLVYAIGLGLKNKIRKDM